MNSTKYEFKPNEQNYQPFFMHYLSDKLSSYAKHLELLDRNFKQTKHYS